MQRFLNTSSQQESYYQKPVNVSLQIQTSGEDYPLYFYGFNGTNETNPLFYGGNASQVYLNLNGGGMNVQI
jgi:hypothetical protein